MRGGRAPNNINKALAFVVRKGSCWEWCGARNKTNYGIITVNRKSLFTHRYFYESYVGTVPKGLVIDHLCRNPSCCNPEHLEPVTVQENAIRGIHPTFKPSSKLYCKRGHKIFAGGAYHLNHGDGTHSRVCKTCASDNKKRYRKAASHA